MTAAEGMSDERFQHIWPLEDVDSTAEHHYTDPLDDVFGSAPPSPTYNNTSLQHSTQNVDPSDVPRLRSTHVTNGYREGIAASKEQHIQEGFDEGYALGAELGLKVGWCLGAIEGLWHAIAREPDSESNGKKQEVKVMMLQARKELKVEKIFGRDYFGEDGVWTYDVPGQESGDGEVTFKHVAGAHPLLSQWEEKISELAIELGISLE